MKKTLIITESQEQALVDYLKQEEQPIVKKGKPYTINPDKVLIVKQFLDKNFKKGNAESLGSNGMPCKIDIVGQISSNGDVLRNLHIEELHDLLIDRFKNMFLDKDERNCFLKQVMNDWFNDKIGVFGTLSVNSIKSNTLFENTVKKYINEELSIADTVKEMSDDIIIKIKEELKNIKTEKDKSNQGVYTSKFHINSEINGKKILVSGTYYNFLNNEVLQKVGNQYDIDYAASVCDGNGINFIFINCYAISGTLQTKSLYGQIYHEVNHIYQGNCGSNVVTNNIKEYSIASGYIYSDNPIDRALSNVIYLNYKFEQDGYINELYGYLKNFGPKPQWKNIYESSTYKAISDFENYIKYITENINNEELIYKCKEKYNLSPQRLIKLGHNSLDRIKRKIAKVLIKYNNDMMNEGINFLYKNCKNKANMYIS